MIDLEDFYPMLFYGGSAVFTVLAIAYLGFDYLEDLSKFTVASIIFLLFVSSFLIATTRESLLKTVFYLTSAGSYLLFLIYIIANFADGTGDTIVLLLLSAGLFSSIGHILTNRQDLIPEKQYVKKIIGFILVLVTLLVIYNIMFVNMSFAVSLEERVTFNETEQKIGELEITKTGYLPLEASGNFVRYCTAENERNLPTDFRSVGEKSFGFAPENYKEDIVFDLNDGFLEHNDEVEGREKINITRNTELDLVRVDSCQDPGIEEGQIGVFIEDSWQD